MKKREPRSRARVSGKKAFPRVTVQLADMTFKVSRDVLEHERAARALVEFLKAAREAGWVVKAGLWTSES